MQEFINKLNLSNQLNYAQLMAQIIAHSSIPKKHKEILMLLLQNRDRNFIRINRNASVRAIIDSYLALIRPICVKNLVRIGGFNDGGYVMIPPPAKGFKRAF